MSAVKGEAFSRLPSCNEVDALWQAQHRRRCRRRPLFDDETNGKTKRFHMTYIHHLLLGASDPALHCLPTRRVQMNQRCCIHPRVL
jgi:hypothetical protein